MGRFKEKFIETYSEAGYGLGRSTGVVPEEERHFPAWMCSCKVYDDDHDDCYDQESLYQYQVMPFGILKMHRQPFVERLTIF